VASLTFAAFNSPLRIQRKTLSRFTPSNFEIDGGDKNLSTSGNLHPPRRDEIIEVVQCVKNAAGDSVVRRLRNFSTRSPAGQRRWSHAQVRRGSRVVQQTTWKILAPFRHTLSPQLKKKRRWVTQT
jgi:hypothetical protein